MSETLGECLTVPALGRHFSLGSLYDARSDRLLEGVTFLDESSLSRKSVKPRPFTAFQAIKSDDIKDISKAFDISAGVKLSFLTGLLSVSGSGKYLENKTSSAHNRGLDLQLRCTNRYEELTFEPEKWKEQYRAKFDHNIIRNIATHVVTGIEYGGYAFFEFHEDKSSKSKVSEKRADLKFSDIVQNLVEVKGHIKHSKYTKEEIGQFRCRYIGDFHPPVYPRSLEDALQLYSDVPKLLGEDGKYAVPINATLFPLDKLDSQACKLVREINDSIVMDIEKSLDDLLKLEVQCTGLINSEMSKNLPVINEEIEQFADLLKKYKKQFTTDLSKLVPNVRSGEKEVEVLKRLLSEKELSPFSHKSLHDWIKRKENQLQFLSKIAHELPVKYAHSQITLKSEAISRSHIICFSILLPGSNKQLTTMENYCKNERCNSGSDVTDEGKEVQSEDDIIGDSIMEKARHFRKFVLANITNANTGFFMEGGLSDSKEFQAKIIYLKDGINVQDFECLSAPSTVSIVKEKTSHNSITVRWDPPLHGRSDTIQYSISYKSDNRKTETVETSANDATINNLEPGCEYRVWVQSLCQAGRSPPTEEIIVKTLPTSPPGKPEILSESHTEIRMMWPEPSVIGPQCEIANYILMEQQEESTWTEKTSTRGINNTIIKVRSSGIYRFKVYCDCGAKGISLESEPSEIRIGSQSEEYLKVNQRPNSSLVHEGISIYKPPLIKVESHFPFGINTFEFGSRATNAPEKVIIMVGTAQSGKTALINGMVNYVVGVDPDGNFCYRLIEDPNNQDQNESDFENISCYTIYHQKGFRVNYTLKIIDIPEFHDLSNTDRNRAIRQQMYSLFTTEGIGGITYLDAICIVTQSSPPKDIKVLDHFLSLFGKNLDNNIFHLFNVTHDDKRFFSFNMDSYNSVFVNENPVVQDDNATSTNSLNSTFQEIDTIFWQIRDQNFKDFLDKLHHIVPKSLRLTKKVSHYNIWLETALRNMTNETKSTMRLFDSLCNKHNHINWEEDFEYTVTKRSDPERVELPSDQQALNCLRCSFTCQILYYENPGFRERGGNCDICPEGCPTRSHQTSRYRYVVKNIESKKTKEKLKQLCRSVVDEGIGDKLTRELEEELLKVHGEVEGMLQTALNSHRFLKDKTLTQNPLHDVTFINRLMKQDKAETHKQWLPRSAKLREVKQVAEIIKQISYGPYKPFRKIIEIFKENLFVGSSDYILRKSCKRSGLLTVYNIFHKIERQYKLK